MNETLLIGAAFVLVACCAILVWRSVALSRSLDLMRVAQVSIAEEKHRAMLTDLHDGLAKQGGRIGEAQSASTERLRESVSNELTQTRETLHAMRLALTNSLGESRQAMVEQLASTTESLNAKIDARLEQISVKVNERLDEGFKKTNETFANVVAQIATIQEAQRKIETLTGSVVSLQELLGDKRSRGAFGEVQLEALVRNVMPPGSYGFQYTLSNGNRADCVLILPAPTGMVAVDSKFPLESYRGMFDPAAAEGDRNLAKKQFRVDVKKHVADIAAKYIIANETSDGAVMFLPAEAVFAEIHAYHPDVVEFANARRVWITSPTTLMAILNTACAVLKDVETRKQVHVIKEALGKLARDFVLFDERMKKLADHIRLAGKDVDDLHISSRKITQRFEQIESVELEQPPALPEPDAN